MPEQHAKTPKTAPSAAVTVQMTVLGSTSSPPYRWKEGRKEGRKYINCIDIYSNKEINKQMNRGKKETFMRERDKQNEVGEQR